MIFVSITNSCADFTLAILVFVGVEIVSGGADHSNQRSLGIDEVNAPDQSKDHNDYHVDPNTLLVCRQFECSVLGDVSKISRISFDLTHRVDTDYCNEPN